MSYQYGPGKWRPVHECFAALASTTWEEINRLGRIEANMRDFIRTHSEMFETPWREYMEHGTKYRIKVEAGLRYIHGNAGAYFSCTYTQERKSRNHRWCEDSFGSNSKLIGKRFPELKFMLCWHSFTPGKGPMHYPDDFWLRYADWGSPAGSGPNIEYFKSTTCWGRLEDDREIPSIETCKSVLLARLPRLIEAFEEDYTRFKSLEILSPVK